jgi:hypothetical protein
MGEEASADMFGEEFAHGRADFVGVSFQRKVTAIDEADVGLRNVAPEGFGSCGDEERVVFSPHCQHRRTMFTQKFLDLAVNRDVGFVVAQQVQLDFVVPRTSQIKVIEVAAVRRD